MPLALDFFLHYAYLLLFLWIMAEQLGLPIPSIPLLFTTGILTGAGDLSLALCLFAILAACLVSDSLWYAMGKRYGGAMVKMVCRLAFETSNCIRKTEDYFTRRGPATLLIAKFVPGLGTVAAPIAGRTGMPYATFLAYDMTGALLWGGAMTLLGRLFGDMIRRNPQALSGLGHFAGGLFLAGIAGLLLYRVWKQRAFLRQIRTSRLDPAELKRMLDAGQQVYIVDLRHPLDYLPDPRVLPGAVRFSPDTLMRHSAEIPRDRDVVLYCTSPSEATAARMAMKLRESGVYRVRPLLGGFERWKKLGFPLEDYEEQPASMA